MYEKSGIFNSNSVPTYRTRTITNKRTVPTYRTRTITKKAYRTNVPYLLAKIEAYRTVPTYRTVPYCHPWRLQRYSTNTKIYPPKKVFGNSEFCSSHQNYSRPTESCGFGGKNKTQSFQKLFSEDIFLHLLNIFATAASKLKQKISKIVVQF